MGGSGRGGRRLRGRGRGARREQRQRQEGSPKHRKVDVLHGKQVTCLSSLDSPAFCPVRMGMGTSTPGKHRRRLRRSFPVVGLLLYYGMLALAATVLVTFVPGMRDALVAPITDPGGSASILGRSDAVAAIQPHSPWGGTVGRGALALVAMSWALAVALPVAWVLMRTRRLRYDPSLVHTIIVLPIVVAGVVLVVKNSLALAFALAGIVAGVRFRQKLDEPEEAVYVLLALGIGLAAGVQALDVALAMSMVFSLVVMTFWRFDLMSIYAKGKGAQLQICDPKLLARWNRADMREALEREAALADGMKPDGIVIIRAVDGEAARRAIETVAGRLC